MQKPAKNVYVNKNSESFLFARNIITHNTKSVTANKKSGIALI